MKSFFYFAFALASVIVLAGCSNKKSNEESANDSAKLAQIQADLEKQRKDSIEKVRVDSIRQDSIMRAERKKNLITISTFCERNKEDKTMVVRNFDSIKKVLISKGFKVTGQRSEYVEAGCDDAHTNKIYTLERDLNNALIKITLDTDLAMLEVTFGDDADLQDFLSSLPGAGYKRSGAGHYDGPNQDCYWANSSIDVQGHTVKINNIWEC